MNYSLYSPNEDGSFKKVKEFTDEKEYSDFVAQILKQELEEMLKECPEKIHQKITRWFKTYQKSAIKKARCDFKKRD